MPETAASVHATANALEHPRIRFEATRYRFGALWCFIYALRVAAVHCGCATVHCTDAAIVVALVCLVSLCCARERNFPLCDTSPLPAAAQDLADRLQRLIASAESPRHATHEAYGDSIAQGTRRAAGSDAHSTGSGSEGTFESESEQLEVEEYGSDFDVEEG